MAKAKTPKYAGDGGLYSLPLDQLHLDHGNPRFAGRGLTPSDESKIVDEIIGQHGIDDVLSSIAANGYFESEPLVGAIKKSHGSEVTVVEGNRRLTACLVLAGDARASGHERLRSRHPNSQFRSGMELPIRVYDWSDSQHRSRLLPYLGVRHIIGARQWDSFAKAAWVVETLESAALSLDDIKKMIGDREGFTDRIVEAFYVVQQARTEGAYHAEESLRKGRGSLTAFPFSWMYTALGYESIRRFLGLGEKNVLTDHPLDEQHVPVAGQLMQFLFGGRGRNAAISESREIKYLARALASPRALELLSDGSSAEAALDASKPPDERLFEHLRQADRSLADAEKVAGGLPSVDRECLTRLEEMADGIGARLDTFERSMERLRSSARRSRASRKGRRNS